MRVCRLPIFLHSRLWIARSPANYSSGRRLAKDLMSRRIGMIVIMGAAMNTGAHTLVGGGAKSLPKRPNAARKIPKPRSHLPPYALSAYQLLSEINALRIRMPYTRFIGTFLMISGTASNAVKMPMPMWTYGIGTITNFSPQP